MLLLFNSDHLYEEATGKQVDEFVEYLVSQKLSVDECVLVASEYNIPMDKGFEVKGLFKQRKNGFRLGDYLLLIGKFSQSLTLANLKVFVQITF